MMQGNVAKTVAVDPATVSDYSIGTDTPIQTQHVWIQCKLKYDQDEPERRACFAEHGDREPQIGDEIAVTGFGGQCWYAGRIFSMQPAKRGKRKEIT